MAILKLPTQKEFDDLTNVLEKLFENGVPSGAKFMMRRATMAGTRGAIRSFIPATALGKVWQEKVLLKVLHL